MTRPIARPIGPVRHAKRAARFVLNEVLDLYDAVRGRRDALVPPRNNIFVGAGDFRETGDEFLRYFVELGGLRPTDRVLDVGCGIGRMARALTGYLAAEGRYEGFDIVPEGIEWCRTRITPQHPNFHFQLADVHNTHYNPGGRQAPSAYRFPFAAGSFDFVFLTSVFTHMVREDMEHYASEIARVLAPGGRVLATYFLLTEESRALVSAGRSAFPLPCGDDEVRWSVPGDPAAAIAFDEALVRRVFAERGLVPHAPVQYGSWCGRSQYVSFQDLVVARKA